AEMKKMLDDIKSGKFAKGWVEENNTGRNWFEGQRKKERGHIIENVGARLRSLMPFLRPVTITDEDVVGSGAQKNGEVPSSRSRGLPGARIAAAPDAPGNQPGDVGHAQSAVRASPCPGGARQAPRHRARPRGPLTRQRRTDGRGLGRPRRAV